MYIVKTTQTKSGYLANCLCKFYKTINYVYNFNNYVTTFLSPIKALPWFTFQYYPGRFNIIHNFRTKAPVYELLLAK